MIIVTDFFLIFFKLSTFVGSIVTDDNIGNKHFEYDHNLLGW